MPVTTSGTMWCPHGPSPLSKNITHHLLSTYWVSSVLQILPNFILVELCELGIMDYRCGN